MKTYKYGNGVEISPRTQPCGTFSAMGETHIEEEKVFDVMKNGKLMATAETWDQAKGVVFDILSNTHYQERGQKP
jgi:hypothetical protein